MNNNEDRLRRLPELEQARRAQLEASLERIQRIVQTQYDLLAGKREDVPEVPPLTPAALMNIGQFIAVAKNVIGEITEEQAQAFYDEATNAEVKLAMASISRGEIGFKPGVPLTGLTQEQQDDITRYFFGSLPKDPEVGITFKPKVFTVDNALTLVNEITRDLLAGSGVTDREAIADMRSVIATTLYAEWEVTLEGGLIVGSPPDVSNIGGPLFQNDLSDRLERLSNELQYDPEHILTAWKVDEVLDLFEVAGVIDNPQKKYMKFPGAEFLEEELAALLPEGMTVDQLNTDLLAMMKSVTQFAKANWIDVINTVESTEGSTTVSEAYLKLIEADKKLPLEEREVPPLGHDPVLQRQAEAKEQFLSAYGEEGKPFDDRVTDLMRSLGIETNTDLITDPNLKKATTDANALIRERLEAVRSKKDLEGKINEEIFQAVFDEAQAIVTGGVTTTQGGTYEEILAQRVELRGQYDLTTGAGRTTFVNRYPKWKLLTEDESIQLLSDIKVMSLSQAEEHFSQYLEPALQRSRREKYDNAAALKDFDTWYKGKGLNPDDLDPNERLDWIDRVWRAGGIPELLNIQEQALIQSQVPPPSAFFQDPQPPREEIPLSEDEVASALLDNIARYNAAALDEPPEGTEALNKFLRDEFFRATEGEDLNDFPYVERRLRIEVFDMGRDATSRYISDNVDRLLEEAAAAAVIPASRGIAESQIRDMYVKAGYDLGEIPAEIVNSAAAELYRSGEGLTEELRQKFISDLETQLPELAEKKAFARTETQAGLYEFAFDLAVDEGIISPSASPEFIQHFQFNTIPRVVEAAQVGDFETTGEFTEFFLNEFRLGRPAVEEPVTGLAIPEPSVAPFDPYAIPDPATGEVFRRPAPFDPYGIPDPATGEVFAPPSPLDEPVTEAPVGEPTETAADLMPADVSEEDYDIQFGMQIPAFPERFGTPFDIPSPEVVKASSDRVLAAREKEQAALDFARVQEQMGDDMPGMSFEEYYASRGNLPQLSTMLDAEKLAQVGRRAQDPLYSPGATGDPERIRVLEEQIAKLQPFSVQMEKARRARRREDEDREYVLEQGRLRRTPQLASATAFATAIREAAPEDIGFQQFLIGEQQGIQAGFKGTAGTPLDFSEYFVGITPGLRRRFGQTPQGIASAVQRMEREEREGERLEVETEREESEAERDRRRALRERGTTALRL